MAYNLWVEKRRVFEKEAKEENTKHQHPSSIEDPMTRHQPWGLEPGASLAIGIWDLEL
jgi:hypothetical protein